MSSPVPRRSGRAPKPNPRYEDEVPWNDDTLRLLRADSDTSNDSSTSDPSQDQPDPDVEMAEFEVADVDMEDMEDAVEDEEQEHFVSQTRQVTIEALSSSPHISDDDQPIRRKIKHTKSSFRMAKKEMYPQVFGPDLEDLYPVLQSRDMWHLNTRDLVFPSRATLKEALRLDGKGEYLERKQMGNTANIPSHHQQIEEITRDEAIARRYLELCEAHDVVLGPTDTGQRYTIQQHEAFQIAQAWPRVPTDETSMTDGAAIDEAYHKGWLLNLGARPQYLVWAPSTSNDQFLAVTFRCSKSQRDTVPPRDSKIAPAFSPSPAYPSRIEIWRIKAKQGVDEEPAQLDHHTLPQLIQVLCACYGNILKMEWLPVADARGQHALCILSSDGNIIILNLDLVDQASPLYLHIKHPQFIATPPPNTIFTSFTLPNSQDLIASDAAGAIHLFSLLSDLPTLTPYSTLQIHMTYITAISSIPSHPYYISTSTAAGEQILTDLRSPTIDRIRHQSARLPTRNLSYLPFTRTFLTTLDSASRYESVSFHGPLVVSHSLRDFKTNKPILRLPLLGGVATCLATSMIHPVIAVGNAGGAVFTSNYLRRCLPIGNPKKDRVGAWMVRLFGHEWRGLTGGELKEQERGGKSDSTSGKVGSTAPSTNFDNAPDVSTTAVTNDANAPLQDSSSSSSSAPVAQQSTSQNQDQDPIDLYHGPSRPKPGISRFTEGYMSERVTVSNLDAARSSGKPKSKSKSKSKAKKKSKTKAKSKSKSRNTETGEYDYADDDEDEDEDEDDGEEGERQGDGGGGGASQVIYHEEQAVAGIAWNGNSNPRFASWVAVGWGSGIVRVADLGHDVV